MVGSCFWGRRGGTARAAAAALVAGVQVAPDDDIVDMVYHVDFPLFAVVTDFEVVDLEERRTLAGSFVGELGLEVVVRWKMPLLGAGW